MSTIRLRIDKRLVKSFREEYENKLKEEFNIEPSDSQIITVALVEAKTLKYNIESEIKFMKNGKVVYKFK